MIASPHTYAEWLSVLEMFKNKTDDEAVLAAMRGGTLVWQSGVAERFASRLLDAVNTRLNAASDRFQKDIGRAAGQESAIVRALFALRQELRFLADAVDLPAIPEKDREQYRKIVVGQAEKMQKALEDSAAKDRTGKLASIIRNNRISV